MAKNEKKVSINEFDKVMKKQQQPPKTVDWDGVQIIVSHTIDFTSMMEFVHDVSESCFSESGSFVPEVFDFAVKSNILTRYANFSLPSNLDHQYALIYNTNAVSMVYDMIDHAQLDEIIASAKKRIDYVCDANIVAVRNKLVEIAQAYENIQKETEEMFRGVSQDDISNLLGALTNGKLDESKLIHEYLEQSRAEREKADAEAAQNYPVLTKDQGADG